MKRKYTIVLDVDGVLLDIHTPWLEKYNRLYDDNLRREDIVVWDSHTLVKPECGKKYYGLRTPDLYDEVLPIPGAQDGVEELLRMGHHLVVVTSDTRSHCQAKARALRRFFPDLRDVVFAKEKTATVRCDLLVDDGVHNKPNILLTQPWNKSAALESWQQRANSWTEVLTIVWGCGVYW